MTVRPTFHTEPQRSDGRCYVPCELHKATSFAVIETKKWTSKGRKFTSRRVIKRFPNRNSADLETAAMTRRWEPWNFYKLGKRIIKETVS